MKLLPQFITVHKSECHTCFKEYVIGAPANCCVNCLDNIIQETKEVKWYMRKRYAIHFLLFFIASITVYKYFGATAQLLTAGFFMYGYLNNTILNFITKII